MRGASETLPINRNNLEEYSFHLLETGLDVDTYLKSIDLALETNPGARPLLHSDRGFQYTSPAYKRKFDKAEMIQSMSRVGRCIDNGPMEAFWGTLKSEKYYLNKYSTFEELKIDIEEYIKFYHYERLQKRLNGLSPLEYRPNAA